MRSLGQTANAEQEDLLERVSELEMKKRIIVADANEEFRRILTSGLSAESDMELAGETGEGPEAVRLA